MNKKLDFLKRKNKGKLLIENYHLLFSDFSNKKYIELVDSDEILNNLKLVIDENRFFKNEFLDDMDYKKSSLMNELYEEFKDINAYIFTDDVYYCGMYLVQVREGINKILDITAKTKDNTCFLLAEDFSFSLTVNYYCQNHSDFPEKIELQRTL